MNESQKQAKAKYRASQKGRDKARAYKRVYSRTTQARVYQREYQQRPEVIARRRESDRKRYQNPARRRYAIERGKLRWRDPVLRDHKTRLDYSRNAMARYGLTLKKLDAILAAQGGVCAICRSPEPGTRYGKWCVDHCHKTGVVRGLLCHKCNAALGFVGDQLEPVLRWSKNATKYLKRASRGNNH